MTKAVASSTKTKIASWFFETSDISISTVWFQAL